MKKIFSILFLLLFTINSYSQTFQRMLIPKGKPIEISNGKTEYIESVCLDFFRKAPEKDTKLSNILGTNSENILVEFLNTNQENVSLQSLLNKEKKGIKIFGNENKKNWHLLRFINNTGYDIKIHHPEEFQVLDKPDDFVKDYKTDQKEQWSASLNRYKKDLEYIDKYYEYDYSYNFYDGKMSLHKESLNIIDNVFNFKKEYPNETNTKTKFEFFLNKKVKEKRRAVKKKEDSYDNTLRGQLANIGIGIGEKMTRNSMVNEYNKASKRNLEVEEIHRELFENEKDNIFYIKAKNGTYKKFIKSKNNIGLLYKYSDYTTKYIDRLEENLASKKINEHNIEVLNFLDKKEDEKTYETLGELFPNNSSDFGLQSLSKLKNRLKSKKIKYLFCYGHFKEGAIYTKVNGVEYPFSTKVLYKIAKELGIKIFFIGCKSSLATGGGTGTLENENSVHLLNNISESLKKSNLKDFLKHLVKKSKGKHFVYEFDENTGMVRIKAFEEGSNYEYQNNSYNNTTGNQTIFEYNLFDLLSDIDNMRTGINSLDDLKEYLEKQDKDENK